MKSNTLKQKKGFTLIEILVVIGIIAVLAAIVIVAINPARQFAQARNSQRTSNVNSLLNAVGQNLADNKGVFTCAAGVIPTTATNISSTAGEYDLRACIVPTYIQEIPVDPSTGVAFSSGTYDTKYTIRRDSTTQRIEICAPGGAEPSISGSTAICIIR
jgi:type IV pilus assembly protein PilA